MVPTDPPAPRTSVGRYELRGELGSGAMGTVWRAHDTRLNREVAVKEVHLPHDMPPRERERARARMIREAQAAARVAHPSVVTVHDVLEVDGTPFIVMELLEGESLRDRLRRTGPMPEAEVERIARPLLDALWAAHRAGVVHRDVKPANIMLTSGGTRPVLTDFGIANLPDHGGTALTGTGAILGTAAYAAPERLEHDDNGAVSDLWSLGATLFAALAGESPFKRDTITSTLTAVLTHPVPPVPARGRTASVINGLLERDPRRRLLPERALALLDDPVPTPAPVPTPTPASEPSTGTRPGRSRTPLFVGAAAVLALLVLSAFTVWSVFSSDDREVAADPETPAAEPSPEPSAEPSAQAQEGSTEGAPEGFTRYDDGVVTLVAPEGWAMVENEEDSPGNGVTRLASYEFDTGVETGDMDLFVTRYDLLVFDAEGAMLRMDELLNEDEAYSDAEQLMLEPRLEGPGVQSAVYEATYIHEEREIPERWMFTREITDGNTAVSYRLSFNFPQDLREEQREDFETVLDSFAPSPDGEED
ncbi:serine/threonine-protein kinase [Nocardiopsis sp. NPDC055551]